MPTRVKGAVLHTVLGTRLLKHVAFAIWHDAQTVSNVTFANTVQKLVALSVMVTL